MIIKSRSPQSMWYLSVWGGIMGTFIALMMREYYILHASVERLRIVQGQYYKYISEIKSVVKKYKHGHNALDKESLLSDRINSFMIINRAPDYLKDSTLSYLKDQQLETLLHQINIDDWYNYTNQVLLGVHQPVNKPIHRMTPKRSGKTHGTYEHLGWHIKNRRTSLTGITFSLPIHHAKFWLSSAFGPRKKPTGQWGFHYGIDMAAPRGTPVNAAANGVVTQAEYISGYGKTILLSHDTLYKTRYAHLDTIMAEVGKKVVQNKKIGTVGDTGFTRKMGKDASHLHFELYEDDKKINPLPLLVSS